MTDEIDQLLRSLHLKKIAAIIDDELAHAKTHELSYDTFLARLLRAHQRANHQNFARAIADDHVTVGNEFFETAPVIRGPVAAQSRTDCGIFGRLAAQRRIFVQLFVQKA